MSFPILLAEASGRSSGLFFILFLAFAIAAIVWLLIWLFSEGDADDYTIRSGADADASKGIGNAASSESNSDADDVAVDLSSEKTDSDAGSDDSDSGALDLIGAGAGASASSALAAGTVQDDDSATADDNSATADDDSATAGDDSADADDNSATADDNSADADDDEDDFEAATAEEAADTFAAELAAGEVEQDPVYGIIYKQAPAEVDDLKEIKGVAKVLEGKLNGIGVYRFKQVAVWTDVACAEFSKMLTFKNRIYTDNWLDQAKEFHEKKYGEKL